MHSYIYFLPSLVIGLILVFIALLVLDDISLQITITGLGIAIMALGFAVAVEENNAKRFERIEEKINTLIKSWDLKYNNPAMSVLGEIILIIDKIFSKKNE